MRRAGALALQGEAWEAGLAYLGAEVSSEAPPNSPVQ